MDKFFKENNKWLIPGIAMLLIVTLPGIARMIEVQLPIPTWLLVGAIAIGLMSVGYGISVTNTFAAKIAGIVIPAILLAMIASSLYKMFS